MYRAAPYTYDWTLVHDPYNVLEADGSMTCGLTLYAIAGQLLAGSKPALEPLKTLSDHGHYVWPFTDGRTQGPAVCFFPGYRRTVTIEMKPEQLALLDRLGNPAPVQSGPGGRATLNFERQHYFLYGADVKPEAFYTAVQRSAVGRTQEGGPRTETFAYCVPDAEKTVRVAVVTVTRGGGAAPKVKREVIDSQFPYKDGFPLRAQRIPREKAPTRPWVWLSTARRAPGTVRIDGDLREWQPEVSSAIYVSDHVLAQIDDGHLHAYRDAFKISWDLGLDYRVEWFAAYDDERLYFCARVFDDELVAAGQTGGRPESDRLELRFDLDLEGDLVEPSGRDDLTVWLIPCGAGTRLRIVSEKAGQPPKVLGDAEGALAIWDDARMLVGWAPWRHPGPHVGYLIEAALPWDALGIEPEPGVLLGLDVFAHETDTLKGQPETSILRWAGRACPTGQLRLADGPRGGDAGGREAK